MNAGWRRVQLLPLGTTADESASVPVDCSPYCYNTVYLRSVGTTSAGNITIEEADWDPLSGVPSPGTWSIIGAAIAASTFTGGATLAVRLTVGAYGFVRVRVNDAITGGGSISASLRSMSP